MCGRVVQARGPLQVAILCGLDVPDTRFANVPPRYNAAPSQELWAIRQNNDTGQRSLDLLRWGLVPYWCKKKPQPPPINAKAETVHKLPMFRAAYAKRRCIMPVAKADDQAEGRGLRKGLHHSLSKVARAASAALASTAR